MEGSTVHKYRHAPPLPSYIRERRALDYLCDKLKIKGKDKEFVINFFTVLMYKIAKEKIEGIKKPIILVLDSSTVFRVAIYQAMKMLGKPMELEKLSEGYDSLARLNKIYEKQINFKSIEEVEKEYKKIMDDYDEKKRSLDKRDKAIA